MQPIVSIDFAKDIRRGDQANAARLRRAIDEAPKDATTKPVAWISRFHPSLPVRRSIHRLGI